jgi:G3E family GTPase
MLLNQPLIVDNFRVDAVVTTVDALHGSRQLREHAEAVKQVALADRLVVTKTDLVASQQADTLVAELRDINASAPVWRAPAVELAPCDLFGTRHVDADVDDAPRDHLHGIETFSLQFEQPVEWRAFSAWLNRLKIEHADQLLRVKGIVHVAGEQDPIAIHGVHHVFHPPMRLPRSATPDARSRIVFITRGLARETVVEQWSTLRT